MTRSKQDRSEPRADEVREALLDQLAHLIDEIEALKGVIDRVPSSLQEARPFGDEPSIKELYGLLAIADEQVHLPHLQRMIAVDTPQFHAPPAPDELIAQERWHDHSINVILERVQAARRELVDFLRALPAENWARTGRFGEDERDVYTVAHSITQRDAKRLRTIGYRLHESHLTERPSDLPK